MKYKIGKVSGEKINKDEFDRLEKAGISISIKTFDWGGAYSIELESIQNIKDLTSIFGELIINNNNSIFIYDESIELS